MEKENNILKWINYIYILIILIGIAYYSPERYINLAEHKWHLFIWSTTVYSVVIFIYILINRIHKKINVIDIFAILYAVFCVISYITTPYQPGLWIGAKGWYMGLWSQLCFISMYFAVSRSCKSYDFIVKASVIATLPMFVIAILNRFGLDPLEYYGDITEQQRFYHISTIGQTSWHSSYLILILPLCMAIYTNAESVKQKILYGICISIVSMSLVTCNTDSGYLAFGAMLFVLMWVAFDSNEMMLRLFEIVIISFSSYKFIGILQYIFADNAVQLEQLSMTISQGILSWIVIIASLGIYILLKILIKKYPEFIVSKYRRIRWILLYLTIAMVLLTLIYIFLNTKGTLPESLSSNANYLYFDEEWGNRRGYVWKNTIYAFTHEKWLQRIIGCGPDSFACCLYTIVGKEKIFEYYRNIYNVDYGVMCAHNEWLNGLITMGIVGVVAYIGIFITSLYRNIKNSTKMWLSLGVSMAIAAYMAHNMFCYQQYVCTPVIFLLMGIARSIEESE